MQEIIDTEEQFMSDAAIDVFSQACDGVCASSVFISELFKTFAIIKFYLSIKVHYIMHIKQNTQRSKMNPRASWTPRDEDNMGRMGLIVKSCSKGAGSIRLSRTFTFKLMTGQVIRWVLLSSNRARAKWSVM